MRVAETAARHCHQPLDARWRGPRPSPMVGARGCMGLPFIRRRGGGDHGARVPALHPVLLFTGARLFQLIPTSSPTASQGVRPQLGRHPCPGPPASHPDLLPLAGSTAARAAPSLSLRVTRAGGVLARPRLTHSPGALRGVPARPSYAPFPATLSLRAAQAL